jgi:hypothetical protein
MIWSCRAPAVVDSVTIKQNSGAIPRDPGASTVVHPIAPNCEVMAVIYLERIIGILYLKSLNRDPADPILITRVVLKKNLLGRSLVDKVNDRELTGSTEKLDWS